ncbi:MAG: CPBP family intramembrane glutamic endopeptidase [Bacteroidota bacterium]
MKKVLISNKIASFVTIAYLFSWLVWFVGMAVVGTSSMEDIWFFVLVGSFGPSVAALTMTYVENGVYGIKQLMGSIFRFRFHVTYWLLTLCLLPIIWIIVFLAFGRAAADTDSTRLAYLTVLISPLNALVGILGGIGPVGEEIGWRGYLLERMLQKYSPLQTNVTLGGIWAFWHLPIILFFPEFRDDFSIGVFLLLYPLLTILLTTMMTNFWNWTNGSIFIAIWVHSLVNILLNYGGNAIWIEDDANLHPNIISLIVFAIAAIISSLIFKRKGNRFKEDL